MSAGLAVLACAGWMLAAWLVVRVRRRSALVADAEHELRGAAAAIGLAAERMAREGSTAAFAWLVRLQVERMNGGLADLAAARGRRGAGIAGPELEAGRLAQVLGNLVANATEHGVGPVDVRTTRGGGRVRLEIRNREQGPELAERAGGRGPADPARRPGAAGESRGRGLAIASRAARELGGALRVESQEGETRVVLELPADRAA